MTQETNSSNLGTIMMTFLAGAAVGAVVVALTTPKTGPELRGDLRDAARRAKRKVGQYADEATENWDDLKERTSLAAGDIQRGFSDAAKDLKG
ncbi:MAG: YtxH domain-containing protein [Holophaga sp.]|nr:YtxH domain-containing protein [Holophaga sp.]